MNAEQAARAAQAYQCLSAKAPEPLECWIRKYASGFVGCLAYGTEEKAASGPWRAIHMREVMPGDLHKLACFDEVLDALRDMVSDRNCLSDATVRFAMNAIAKAEGNA